MNTKVDQNSATVLATETTPAGLHAAKGNDEVMSKPPTVLPTAGEVRGMWKQRVGAAKIVWGKLTDDELLQVEGHTQKLAGLIQERYAITLADAEQQVKDFFAKHTN